ncbi:MAG: peroxiredoxin-like family protein [Bacteroidia bacterium]
MKRFKIIFITLSIFSSMSFMYLNQDTPTGLKKGEKAPAFNAKDYNGNSIDLYKLLQNGEVVLMFYRGEWCPYCNKEMSELQDSLHYITEKGAYVIAITPETNNNINKTIKKTKASFSIIHDEGNKIMDLYKTSFVLDSATVEKYKKWNIDLENANGNKDNTLPVPATYVIGKDGIIKYVFFDKDYKNRASVNDIINAL